MVKIGVAPVQRLALCGFSQNAGPHSPQTIPRYPRLGLNFEFQLLLWRGETEEKLLVIQEPTGGNGGVRKRELGLQAGAPE